MTTHDIGMHPGATWRKSDFQIHSPRDPGWSGSPHLPGDDEAGEQARDAWAYAFVNHCFREQLHLIAITDHHDFCMIPYVRRAIERHPNARSTVWLFPGVEVTCQDAVQCLVLFDVDADIGLCRRLFGGHLQNIDEPSNSSSTGPQAIECGKGIEKFLEGLMTETTLSRKTIVLPHASKDGAHKSMLRDGFAPRFAKLPFDGVYTGKAYGQLKGPTLNKIHGKILEWGKRRRGIITTGDNRHHDNRNLGINACWIRMGEPTAEGIRQSVLADRARITYEQPLLPSHRILELLVRSSLTGDRFKLIINDGFNAIIGGRGSGKSSILEYLRFGLGRSSVDIRGEDEEFRARDRALIAETLSTGSVEVVIERDGLVETWRRDGASSQSIRITDADGAEIKLSPIEAQQRFRARGFYQKELSSLFTDQAETAEQITGIAAAEEVDQRRELERKINAQKRAVAAAYQRVEELWRARYDLSVQKSKLDDLVRRIESLKQRLNEMGMSDEHQATLAKAPTYLSLESLYEESFEQTATDLTLLNQLERRLRSVEIKQWSSVETDQSPEFDPIRATLRDIENAAQTVRSGIAIARAAISELELQQKEHFAEFLPYLQKFQGDQQDALLTLATYKSLAAELDTLNKDRQAAEGAYRRASAILIEYEGAEDALVAKRKLLVESVEQLQALLAAAAEKVGLLSGGALRASIEREDTPHQYVDAIKAIFGGSRVRDVDGKCEDRIRGLSLPDAGETWDDMVEKAVQLRRRQLLGNRTAETEPMPESDHTALEALFGGTLTPNQSRSMFNNLSEASIAGMICAVREDHIKFEYRDGGNYSPFHQASPGQQAAALLKLLLNQEAGTLIIDQPEDDLDNGVVMEIASLLQTTKRKRQLVFATHNPNFVVNGDADKIVALRPGASNRVDGQELSEIESPRVAIHTDGAIETPSVRIAVTEIMEGGRIAFELRGRKYSFDNGYS